MPSDQSPTPEQLRKQEAWSKDTNAKYENASPGGQRRKAVAILRGKLPNKPLSAAKCEEPAPGV